MKKRLDEFVDFLQSSINTKVLQTYGEKGYDRWINPRFNGALENFHATARLTGSCGDSMEMFIQMDGERVVDISYRTDGCASSSICGSFAAELALGKSATEVLDLTGEIILKEIGTFPEEDAHCAHLAVSTVKEAVNLYMTNMSGMRSS